LSRHSPDFGAEERHRLAFGPAAQAAPADRDALERSQGLDLANGLTKAHLVPRASPPGGFSKIERQTIVDQAE
jgi:hypothetical protein